MKYLLICVEHLKGWRITRAKVGTAIDLVREEIMNSFGPPKTIVSDNAYYLTEIALDNSMQGNKINGKDFYRVITKIEREVERMVGKFMERVGRFVGSPPSG